MKKLEDQNNLLIYKNKDGNIVIDAVYKDETLWFTQKTMAKIFDCSINNISLHLKDIFKDNELNEKSINENKFSMQYFYKFNNKYLEKTKESSDNNDK